MDPDALVTDQRILLKPSEVDPWQGDEEIFVTHYVLGEKPFPLGGNKWTGVRILPGDRLTVEVKSTREFDWRAFVESPPPTDLTTRG